MKTIAFYTTVLIYTAAVIALFVALLWADMALGQEQPGHTHEGVLGKFYMTWLQPDIRGANGERVASCCGNNDCHPATQIRLHGTEYWFYDDASMEWVHIPAKKLEDNYPDGRESPDGQWHICNRETWVYCVVRGTGT